MRWTKLAAVSVMCCVIPSLAACGEPSPAAKKVMDKASETWDAMKTWSVEKKDDFVKSASPKVEELKQGFADAKASASRTSAEAGQKLEESWNGVQQKFEALKTATGDQWTKQRDAFVEAYEAYKQRLANPTPK